MEQKRLACSAKLAGELGKMSPTSLHMAISGPGASMCLSIYLFHLSGVGETQSFIKDWKEVELHCAHSAT